MTSPVAGLCAALLNRMSGANEFAVFFDDARRRAILRGMIEAYYVEASEGHVLFDTNRSWTGHAALLKDLYPASRIICCVRDVGWIIDSVERMLRKNPLQTSRLFNFRPGSSVYGRVETLMNSDNGLIGLPWATLREAWFSENAHRLIVVRYESLASQPERTLRRLYEFISQPYFAHDFDHVSYDEPDYDGLLGMPGMHKVAEKVTFQERASCIPPDLFSKYADLSFWNRSELNRGKVVVL